MAPQDELINTAILTATHERLQETLVNLVATDRHSRELVEKALLLPASDDSSTPEVDVGPSAGPKRKRYEVCDQCEKEFDILENSSDACVWHSEVLQPDYSASIWANHDENCHGTIDTEEMRKQFPQGFIYGCCEKNGTAEGCEISEHTAAEIAVKLPRS